jgi:polycomb group RING finger protein 3
MKRRHGGDRRTTVDEIDEDNKTKKVTSPSSSSSSSLAMMNSKTTTIDPPKFANSSVNFALGPVNPHFTCRLCDGYFRSPMTITECLHTFCRSCLCYAFASGFHRCPTCDVELGPDPIRFALHDRTKEELLDRILFPDLKDLDMKLESAFYEESGIPLKPEYQVEENRKPNTNNKRHQRQAKIPQNAQSILDQEEDPDYVEDDSVTKIDPITSEDDNVDILLIPQTPTIPSLEYNYLKTSGKMKVYQLKRFVRDQLEEVSSPGQSILSPNTMLEFSIHGNILGNEMSLTFIQRTMCWKNQTEKQRNNNNIQKDGNDYYTHPPSIEIQYNWEEGN